jgi:SAM-dependent methyltransferase
MYSGKQELLDNSQWLRTYNKDTARLLHSATIFKESHERCAIESAPKIKRVLDFGAGIGTITRLIRELDPSSDYFCVELDESLHSLLPGWATVSTQLLDSWTGSMDLIVTSNVIEHIEDDAGILRQLYKTLTDNGMISIYVPACPALWTRMDDNVGHFRRYTMKSLTMLLEDSGFTIENIRYVDSVGGFATFLYRAKERLASSRSYKGPSPRTLRIYDRYLWRLSKVSDLLLHRFFGKNLLVIASKMLPEERPD